MALAPEHFVVFVSLYTHLLVPTGKVYGQVQGLYPCFDVLRCGAPILFPTLTQLANSCSWGVCKVFFD